MITLRALKRQISSAEDLQSVVKTMKAIAAVNIRQYEDAVESLREYRRTLELGMQIVMRRRPEDVRLDRGAAGGRRGVIAFGSEQGLCGQFNDVIERFVRERIGRDGSLASTDNVLLAVVGDRLVARMEAADVPVEKTFRIPGSMAGIRRIVQETLILIESWREDREVAIVDLFYNRPRSGSAYDPHSLRVFPLDTAWLIDLGERPWDARTIPTYTMSWNPLFTSLVREVIGVSLHRAFSESLAAENASRLAAMQAAERNIEEHLDRLHHQYNQQRQRSTTEELLDIIGGFEALRQQGETANA